MEDLGSRGGASQQDAPPHSQHRQEDGTSAAGSHDVRPKGAGIAAAWKTTANSRMSAWIGRGMGFAVACARMTQDFFFAATASSNFFTNSSEFLGSFRAQLLQQKMNSRPSWTTPTAVSGSIGSPDAMQVVSG